jgi:hypothetical protein
MATQFGHTASVGMPWNMKQGQYQEENQFEEPRQDVHQFCRHTTDLMVLTQQNCNLG